MWTEQTVEILKKLAGEGRSASWIAAALGAPSRNAVIGKANRIGIKLNGVRSTLLERGGAAPDEPAIRWERRPSSGRARDPFSSSASGPWRKAIARVRNHTPASRERRAQRTLFASAEVGEMRRVGFMEIGEVECRWPLGDPLQDDFAYCGLPVARGHAYCAGHCRLAYKLPGLDVAPVGAAV